MPVPGKFPGEKLILKRKKALRGPRTAGDLAARPLDLREVAASLRAFHGRLRMLYGVSASGLRVF